MHTKTGRRYVAYVLAPLVVAFTMLAACASQEPAAPAFDEEKIVREGVTQSLGAVSCDALSYEVEDVDVNDGTATVRIRVTAQDQDAVVSRATADAEQLDVATEIARRYFDEDELVEYLSSLLDSAKTATTETTTSRVDIALTKQGDEWVVDASSLDALVDVSRG